jgi:mannose-6-phosphate isomerase-like protein (cupin superfamily)
MKLVKAWEEEGVEIPAPYQRKIKVFFAPDKEDVHDRPELIYIVKGEGICVDNDNNKIPIKEDMVMWVPAGEKHQVINTGYEEIKLATVFIPAYTAQENYARCRDAALAVKKKNNNNKINNKK